MSEGQESSTADVPAEGREADSIAAALLAVADDEPVRLLPGMTVGRYVVVGELGRGSMGVVVKAFDPQLHRVVALKVVQVASSQSGARLVREARAMARLSHPNVVAVYDVLAPEDHQLEPSGAGAQHEVVLAMEYVSGVTLQRWLEDAERSAEEIIDAFVQAGQGLAAAHDEGMMHRDFKPANVLVGEDGRVRVTDFGLARGPTDSSSQAAKAVPMLFSPPLDAQSADITQPGHAAGTPRYMAPEQHRAGELTPALDQYGFYVALWEALTGRAPFRSDRGSMYEAKRKGPPPWPGRSGVPKRVVEALMRGLAPEATERFPDMNALLHAIAPRGRSNRAAWGVAGVMTVVAVIAATRVGQGESKCAGARDLVAEAWGAEQRGRAEEAFAASGSSFAPAVWERVGPQLDDYAEAWAAMHTESCEATQRGEQSAAMMDVRTSCLQRARQDLSAVAEVLQDATPKTVQRAHRIVEGLPPLARCADLEVLQAEVPPPGTDEAEAVQAIHVELAQAAALRDAGEFERALAMVEGAQSRAEELPYEPVRTEVLVLSADVLQRLGRAEEAVAAGRRALELAVANGQRRETLNAARRLIFVLGYDLARKDEALTLQELAMGLARRPEDRAEVLPAVAAVHRRAGEYARAGEMFKEAYDLEVRTRGEDDPATVRARQNYANSLSNQQRFEEAARQHEAVIAALSKLLGPRHPDVAGAHNDLTAIWLGRGDYVRAEKELREALGIWEESLGPLHPLSLLCRSNIAVVLRLQGRLDEALALAEAVLPQRVQTLGDRHPDTALAHDNLAQLLSALGRHKEAEKHARAAVTIFVDAQGAEHPRSALARRSLADALIGQGRFDEAEAELKPAYEAMVASLGPRHDQIGRAHLSWGRLYRGRGELERAAAELDRAVELLAEALGADHPEVVEARRERDRPH